VPAGSRVEDRVVKRGRGQWCWSCQQVKPNEAFSGRNHGRHLCRACASQRRWAAREKRKATISAGQMAADTRATATAYEGARGHERFSEAEGLAAWAAWGDPLDASDLHATPTLEHLLEAVLVLSVDDRGFLAEQLVASLPADPQWLAELECRARRALTDPEGGEAWDRVRPRPARRLELVRQPR
jgi:hypothetical protein